MNHYDYSIQYRNWHDDSPEHHDKEARHRASQIKDRLKLAHDAKILDVGCGFGFALGGLRMLGYSNISGVEQSPQQAESCRKAGFHVDVTDDTIKWLQARPETYDGILLFDVLEHVPVAVQIDFIRAIYSALKPGGQLMLIVPNANSILATRWRYIDYTHFSSFTEHSLSFVLKNGGFQDLWLDNSKGVGPFPRWAIRQRNWDLLRKWFVRWCWLQVFKAEHSFESTDNICFELNLTAVATKDTSGVVV